MGKEKNILDGRMQMFYSTPMSIQRNVFEYIANGKWRVKYPEFLDALEFYICSCRSPIELSLALAFTQTVMIEHKDKKFLHLEPQAEIRAENHLYYADFLFDDRRFNEESKIDYRLVVECDGHDYHHATKQQVSSDYERETNLKLAGFDVLRFTGSQIYAEPYKCADTIIDYILKKVGDTDA